MSIIDSRDLSLDTLATAAASGTLAAYEPLHDRLYFVGQNGRLQTAPAEDVSRPTSARPAGPQPVERVDLPILIPGAPEYRERFALAWLSDATVCRYDALHSSVVYSDDAGATWQPREGGVPSCVALETIAVSPSFESDRTLFGSVHQLGVFRSTDGGVNWHPSSAGLESMLITDVQVSPEFATDHTVFAETHTTDPRDQHAWRSEDGGDTWQPIGQLHQLELSPEFALDRTIYAFGFWSTDLLRSTDGGESWRTVGRIPADERAVAASLLAVRDPHTGRTVLLAHVLDEEGPMLTPVPVLGKHVWRSADGGATWVDILNAGEHISTVTSLAGEREGTVLVVSDTYSDDPRDDIILRSTDAGRTWMRIELPRRVKHPSHLVALPTGHVLFLGEGERQVDVDVAELEGEVYPDAD
jgi:photosystem II stability/assembly factor-like uncharacterized protein